MAGAVVALASVIGGAVGGIASVVGVITSTIGAAIGPVISAIGSSVGGIASAIVSAASAIGSTVISVGQVVWTSISQVAGGIIDTIGQAAASLSKGLAKSISTIAKSLGSAVDGVLKPIKGGLELIKAKVDDVASWVNSAFHPSAELESLKAAHPDMWAAAEGSNSLFIQDLVTSGTISTTQAGLLGMPDVINIINEVSSLKILSDLVKGNASIWDGLDAIAAGNTYETAKAIAKLSGQIITTSVGIMDQVETDVELLQASINSFDENLKRNLELRIEETKAEVLAKITPRLDSLGDYGLALNKKIAAVVRHIEDEDWFLIMLARLLPA
jgi:hypothetical protein